jgi:hypothetical protein
MGVFFIAGWRELQYDKCMATVSGIHSLKRDARPEETSYTDTGCVHHSACLTCPFAVCVFEDTQRRQREVEDRGKVVLRMRAEGATIDHITMALGCSRRTVYRYLGRNYA